MPGNISTNKYSSYTFIFEKNDADHPYSFAEALPLNLEGQISRKTGRHVVLPLLIKEERSDEDRSSWLTIIDIPTKNKMEHGYSVGNLQWKLLRKSVAEIAV